MRPRCCVARARWFDRFWAFFLPTIGRLKCFNIFLTLSVASVCYILCMGCRSRNFHIKEKWVRKKRYRIKRHTQSNLDQGVPSLQAFLMPILDHHRSRAADLLLLFAARIYDIICTTSVRTNRAQELHLSQAARLSLSYVYMYPRLGRASIDGIRR